MSPIADPKTDLSLRQKFIGTWSMLVVKMILAIIIGVSIGIFYDPENLTSSSMTERFTPAVLFIIGVFILPLLEEVAFRLSLKFKPIYLTLTLGVLGYYITSKAIYCVKLTDFHHHFESRVLIGFAIMSIAYPLLSIQKVKRIFTLFWKNNFRWILYATCIAFAWIHILNYELTLMHLLLMPLITLPKLVNALCYGYVRINYGFMYSFAIHIFTNSIAFIVSMISSGSN